MSDGTVRCWGRDKFGQLGLQRGGNDQLTPAAVPGLANVKQIGLAGSFSCALTQQGKVYCWGTGRLLRDGKVVTRPTPVEVPGVSDAEEIAVSGNVVCARSRATITCWGTERPLNIESADAADAAEVAVASTHACVRKNAGTVRCAGDSVWSKGGALSEPPITQVSKLVTGDAFACALDKAGKVLCWGRNDHGQLGAEADFDTHNKPREVAVRDVATLSAGETQACAVHKNGTASCWGNNADGELGIGRTSNDERPSVITGLSDVEEICLASIHGCARTKSGEVYCWGGNPSGQLGDGTEEPRTSPTRVRF
jgi:alpha-tubulin suppressor-like RCC1 family protein